jgi:hypothetical protein
VFDRSTSGGAVLLHKLRNATETLNRPVELLSPSHLLEKKNVEFVKYSVVGSETVATVSVNFLKPTARPICITKCPRTQCQGRRTKEVFAEPGLTDVNVDDCCEHISTLWISNKVQMDFEWCFGPQEPLNAEEPWDAPQETPHGQETSNGQETLDAPHMTAEIHPEQELDKYFDKEKNLWIYKSFVGVEGYQPCEDISDPVLVR